MLPPLNYTLQFDSNAIFSDVSFLSSIAIILGALFVVFEIRDNKKLVEASGEQARAAARQAELTTEQMKQNNALANMDLVMRLYEFANTAEFQSAWLTVLSAKVNSFEEFGKLARSDQISFYQVAALFESLGVLVERGLVQPDVIDDTFLTGLAWTTLQPFVKGMREKYGDDQSYVFFEKLYHKLNYDPKPTEKV
ncbi:MAG: DUF4760 domain-containing protein [Nitrososphaerales archaeon]